MIAIAVASQLALMIPGAGGSGCFTGDSQTCVVSGCAFATQTCMNGAWGACRCQVQNCDSTPCVSASIEFDPDTGLATCLKANLQVSTSCGNGATCNGTDHCAGGVCVAGDPLAISSSSTCGTGTQATTTPLNQPKKQVFASPAAASNPLRHAVPSMPTAGAPTVNENKGSLTYDYSFQLPKARGRFQPDLRLRYTSESVRNTGFGVGWSLTETFIEATPAEPLAPSLFNFPKTAVQRVKWFLQAGHDRRRLLPVASGSSSYQTEVMGGFAAISVGADGTWTAKDLVGSSYTFSHHVSLTGTMGTGRYYLTKVVDVDGNSTEYTHQGERLDKISYNNVPVGLGSGYATQVTLSYVDVTPARIDRITDAVVRRTNALSRVTISRLKADGTLVDLLWHDLGYQRLQRNASVVLADITVRAGDVASPASLPPVLFTYGDVGGGYYLADGVDVPSLSSPAPWLLQDLDGDGLVDFLDYGASDFYFKWQRGRGLDGAGVPLFDSPVQFTLAQPLAWPASSKVMLWDVNGDGVLDLVSWNASGEANGQEILVQYGAVGASPSFGPVEYLDASAVINAFPQFAPHGGFWSLSWNDAGGMAGYQLLDYTGDGVLDILIVDYLYNYYLAQGGRDLFGSFRFATPVPLGALSPAGLSDFLEEGLDLNGDGFGWDQADSYNQGLARAGNLGVWTTSAAPATWLSSPSVDLAPLSMAIYPDYAQVPTFPLVGWPCFGGKAIYGYTMGSLNCSLGIPRLDAGRAATSTPVDLDGDGRPDLVTKNAPGDGCPVVACLPTTLINRSVTEATVCGQACPLTVWGNTGSGYVKQGTLAPLDSASRGGARADLYPETQDRSFPFDTTNPFDSTYRRGFGYAMSGPSIASWWADVDGDGIMDHLTRSDGVVRFFRGMATPVMLTSMVTPTGATYRVDYAPSRSFGAGPMDGPRQVVTRLTVSGPTIPTSSTAYSYEGPAHGRSAVDPEHPEPRGFGVTWSWLEQQVGPTKVAQRTAWAQGSHALVGAAIATAHGTFSGATPATGFSPFRVAQSVFFVRAPANASCLNASSETPASSYPGVVPVALYELASATVDGVLTLGSVDSLGGDAIAPAKAFVSMKTRSCADVDDVGNVLKTTVDPDAARPNAPGYSGDEYVEIAKFDSTAACRNCPVETQRTDLLGNVIADSVYFYDSPPATSTTPATWNAPLAQGKAGNGHANYVKRWVQSGTSRWEIESAVAYNGDGTVAFKVTDPYPLTHSVATTESYAYDPQRLRVTDTTVSDGTVTLQRHTDYDPITGLAVAETGPWVVGSGAPSMSKAFARDVFGRVIAVGSAMVGGVLNGTVSTTEYFDVARMVRTSVMLAPMDLVPRVVPTTPDVKQTVEYRDELGRVVQMKERRGGTGAASTLSQIIENLSGDASKAYRSASHVQYDAAGRVVRSLEPQDSATEGRDDFVASAIGDAKGAITRFDALGRVICAQTGMWTAIVGDVACTSSPAKNANYRMATLFSYRMTTGGGRLLAATKVFPPSSDGKLAGGLPEGSGAVETGFDGDGLAALVTDAAGNTVTTTISPVAANRTVSVTRQAYGVPTSAQTSTRLLDSLGRTLEEYDDNWSPGSLPSRRYTYDAQGRPYSVDLPPVLVGAWNVRPQMRTKFKSLGRKTGVEVYEPGVNASGAVTFSTRSLAGFTYDTPPGGDTATYKYTAGRLATVASPLTTVSLGYDQYGQQDTRYQTITGLAGQTFKLTALNAPDGRLLWSQFDSSYANRVTVTDRYDSMGRLVQLDAGSIGPKFWEARHATNGSHDGYDLYDRTGNVYSNNGKVQTARTYDPYTGSLATQTTSYVATNANIYAISDFGYQGTRLASMADITNPAVPVTKAFNYDPQGRLVSASANAIGSAPLAQTYSENYRHGDPAWGADSSLGNLGQVTDGTGTTSYAYLADRVAEQKGAKAYLFQYDHAGRLTSRRQTSSNSSAAEVEGYAFDVEDRLRMAKAGTVREYLDYDPTGLPLFRLTQTLSGGTVTSAVGTWYVGKSATMTAPVSPTCTGAASCTPKDPATGQSVTPSVAVHLLMGGTRIATVRPVPGTGVDACANVLYYHRDYQGSVVGTSLRSGGVDGVAGAGYRYTPYGQLDRATNVTAANDSELGYTNGLRLLRQPGVTPALPQGPGLVLLGARVYHAELKRWLQPDTVDALRYTYTGGDPVNFIDPSGRVMQDPSGSPGRAISNWDFLGDFQSTLSPANGGVPAPPNNEPAPTPVAQGPGAKTAEATVSQDKVAVAVPGTEGELSEIDAVASARAVRRDRLVKAQDEARANSDYQPLDGKTHCNQSTCAIADKTGAPTFPLMGPTTPDGPGYANRMAQNLAGGASARFPGFYREVVPAEAQSLANDGYLVVAAWRNPAASNPDSGGPGKSGHVVTVRPEGVQGDPTPKGTTPLFNQVGGSVGITRGAFLGSQMPDVHYYTPQVLGRIP